MGWQPDLEGCSNATGSGERLAHLLAARQRRFPAVGHPTACSAADGARSRSRFSISLTHLSPHLSTDSQSVRNQYSVAEQRFCHVFGMVNIGEIFAWFVTEFLVRRVHAQEGVAFSRNA